MNVAVLGTIADSDYSLPSPMWQSPALVAAMTIVALGANARLAASIRQESAGNALVRQLEHASVDTALIQRSAEPALSRSLPIDDLLTAGSCAIDLDDPHLFRFLVDLPVHTHPAAQLVGSLDRLATFPPAISREIVERLDAVSGTMGIAMAFTGCGDFTEALSRIQGVMRGNNLRYAFFSGAEGQDYLVSRDSVWMATTVVPPGDSQTRIGGALGSLACGLASRRSFEELSRLCVVASRTPAWLKPWGETAASLDIIQLD